MRGSEWLRKWRRRWQWHLWLSRKSIHFSGARKEVDVATEYDDGFSAEEAEAAVDDKVDSAGEDASDVSKNIESSESSVSDEVRDYAKIPEK